MYFTNDRDCQQQVVNAALKIVQALQEPGDQICVSMDGLDVVVTLDAVMFKANELCQRVRFCLGRCPRRTCECSRHCYHCMYRYAHLL